MACGYLFFKGGNGMKPCKDCTYGSKRVDNFGHIHEFFPCGLTDKLVHENHTCKEHIDKDVKKWM